MFRQQILFLLASGAVGISADRATGQTTGDPVMATSQWVSVSPRGRLQYKELPRGDRIMDFSYAGYMGGGVSIPSVSVKITLSPVSGDNSVAIQDAIDRISAMKPENGFRGAILLKPGTYNCEEGLVIRASGVVLRGSGSGEGGTVIHMVGRPHSCVQVQGEVSTTTIGEPKRMTDAYVPSGTHTFHLNDVSGLAVGDTIRISRPVTEAWVHFMGMDKLVRDGRVQTWITGEVPTERVIEAISGKQVKVSTPLTDSYDSTYLNPPGTTVVKISSSKELSQIGIENFSVVCPEQTGTITQRQHSGFSIGRISDSWVRNIKIHNTVGSVGVRGNRITIENVNVVHDAPTAGAAKPADFSVKGTQILFDRCSVVGDGLFFFATGAKVTGPIVLLNCMFRGNGWIQPHQRWATGLLVDECQVPDGGIDFMNRGEMGSGHGWTIGWAVAWNCTAKSFLNQQPPGTVNWVIGGRGEKIQSPMPFTEDPMEPESIYDSHGIPVIPASLYLSQLRERLGDQALENIGYGITDLTLISYE